MRFIFLLKIKSPVVKILINFKLFIFTRLACISYSSTIYIQLILLKKLILFRKNQNFVSCFFFNFFLNKTPFY